MTRRHGLLVIAIAGLFCGACDQSLPRGAVGVDACDEWVAKYQRCIDEKMPEEGREAMRKSMLDSIQTWKANAQTSGGQKALDRACRGMIESTRRATASLGCEW